MDNYIYTIPDFDKHILEAEGFFLRLTDNRFAAEKWSLLWKNLNIVCIRLANLERKWKGYKKSTGITPKQVIKRDMDSLMHRLDPKLDTDIRENESAIEWGIRSSQSMIDEFPILLPYLKQADFYVFVKEIGDLLEAVINRTKHNEVMKLLREFRRHPDIVVIGQFSTGEMVEYYMDCTPSAGQIGLGEPGQVVRSSSG